MTDAFEGIRRGLLDAIAYAKGDKSKGRVVASPTSNPEADPADKERGTAVDRAGSD